MMASKENSLGMKNIFGKILIVLVQLVIVSLLLTTIVQQGWKYDIRESNASVDADPCVLDESRSVALYMGQINDQEILTFTSPESYSGPVVQGWEPERARNISLYLKPNKSTVLLEPVGPDDDFWCYRTKLIIFQHTRPGSFSNRRDNRRTWINYIQENRMAKVFYVVGRASGDKASQIEAKLVQESQVYNDILQLDFIDHANNNTLKTLLTFKYLLSINWPNSFPEYVMKADDDIYINLPLLQSILFTGNPPGNKTALLGWLHKKSPVLKILPDRMNETYSDYLRCPSYMYDKLMYPVFPSGVGYILPWWSIQCLYTQSYLLPYFFIEDVHIGGFLADRCLLGKIHLEGYSPFGKDGRIDASKDLLIHYVDHEKKYDLHKAITADLDKNLDTLL